MSQKIFYEAPRGTLPTELVFETELELKGQRQGVLVSTLEIVCISQGLMEPGERLRLLNPANWAKDAVVELPNGHRIRAELVAQYPWITGKKGIRDHWARRQDVPDMRQDPRKMKYEAVIEDFVEQGLEPHQGEVMTTIDVISGLVEEEHSRRLYDKARDWLFYHSVEVVRHADFVSQCDGCYELRYPEHVYQVIFLEAKYGRDHYELVRLP